MADISTIPTQQLLALRQQSQRQPVQDVNIQNISTEQLLALKQQSQRQPVQQIDQQRIDQLFEQLGGKLPTGILPEIPFPTTELGIGQTAALAQRRKEIERQQAFSELQQRGFTPKQIQLSLQVQNRLGRPRIGRGAGGIGGALAATAIAGRLIPGPFDDAAILAGLIAVGGAGIGGVAGEAAQTGIEEKRLIGKREALKAFAIEAGTELGGRAVVRTGKFLFSPFIKKTVPEAAALIDDFAKVGGSFSPSELDSRFSLRIGEAFSRGGFGAKEIFQEFEERQGRAVFAFADNIVESISQGVARQTPREIGEAFAVGITKPDGRIFNILDDLFDPLYKQVDDLAQEGAQRGFRQIGAGGKAVRGISGRFQPVKELQRVRITPSVSTKKLKQFALKNLATDKRLNGQFLSPTGRSKLKKIVDGEDFLTFSDMRRLRSSFLRAGRKMARDVDESESIIKQLAGITDDAIFDPKATKGISPDALNLLRNTNRLYKTSQETLKTTFSESLAKRLLVNPSSVVKEVIPTGNPKAMEILRKSLVEPIPGKQSVQGKILWNQLRQAWLADAIEEATKEGVANPKVYNTLLRKMGREAFEEMFPEPSVRASVDKIQTLFSIAGKVPPTGASLFSRGAQTLGVVKMWQGAKAADFIGITQGGILSIGPLAFAKLATNPKGIKFLTTGFKLKPGAKAIVPNVVRMVRLLREISAKENRQRLSEERRKLQRIRAAREPTLKQLRGFGGRGF